MITNPPAVPQPAALDDESMPSSRPSFGIDFFNPQAFEQAGRVAQMFSQSALVPIVYQGKIGNCILALDIAARTGSSALMVMQNLNIIHGKPSWSSQYIIAAINSCGTFTPLRYEMTHGGQQTIKGIAVKDNISCVAYAWESNVPVASRTKENRLCSPPVSCETAILEGWWQKTGSKWPSMTELMLTYRAATLFGRMYASEKLMGMQSQDEVIDIGALEPLDEIKKTEEVQRQLNAPAAEGAAAPRKKRGAAAVEPAHAPAAQVTPPVDNAHVAEGCEQFTEEKPVAAPAPEKVLTKHTSVVKSALPQPLQDGSVITKVDLIGRPDVEGDFTGVAYFEKPLAEFACNNDVIEFMLELRPHKTDKTKTVNIIASYTSDLG